MKILLLAYACEPNRGSEPGIGWKWALQLAKNFNKDVYVLTRKNNKDVIDSYWNQNQKPVNLHFYYTDLGAVGIWAKHHGMPVNVYYALWLKKASDYAKHLNNELHFDVAHHITFGVFRDASMLYKLEIPYVVGPLGGGEYTPKGLTSLYSFKGKIKEMMRKAANQLALNNPYLKRSFNGASIILAKTEDTKALLPKWEYKTEVKLELGLNSITPSDRKLKNEFLFVGRFIEWKGIGLVLDAFYRFHKCYADAHLTLIGEGELLEIILAFRSNKKLDNVITVLPWMRQVQLIEYYKTSTALLFPSLHDSSGNVVLEAISYGLPVICLDCGGPASVKGKDLTQLTVGTKDKGYNEVVDSIVKKMQLLQDKRLFQKESEASLMRAKDFLWDNTVDELYDRIELLINQRRKES